MNTILLNLLFVSATNQFGLPANLLSSLCYVESTHNVAAVHKDDGTTNSVGVCQVKLKTAQWLGFNGSEKDLMDPAINIHYSAKYLSYQLTRYQNNTPKAVTAYNRGNAKGLTRSAYSDKVITQWRKSNVRCDTKSCPYTH